MAANHLQLPGVPGNYAWVPNDPTLNGTGTLVFIAKVNLNVWTPGANQVWISKWTGSAGYLFFLESTSNDLKLMWRDSGPARIAQATVTPTAGGDGWLWVMAVATEDGVDRDVIFSTSTDMTDDPDAVTWTQLGAEVVVPFGAADLTTNTAPVFIGAQSATVNTMAGSIAAARINFAGVTQLDIDFTDLTAAEVAAATFIEDSSNAATVTLTGAELALAPAPLGPWSAVYQESDGKLLSVATVVPPLSVGLASILITGPPGRETWNPATLVFDPAPLPPPDIDRVEEFVDALDPAGHTSPTDKADIRAELALLLGPHRFRDVSEQRDLEE